MKISPYFVAIFLLRRSAALSVGCDNCLGKSHPHLIQQCIQVAGNPVIGISQNSPAYLGATKYCNKVVDRWNCCFPQPNGAVCSSNVETCTKPTIVSKRDLAFVFDHRNHTEVIVPRENAIASDLEPRGNAEICCNVAKMLLSGGIARLMQGRIQTDDDGEALILVLVSAWAIAAGCNQIYPMTCVLWSGLTMRGMD